MLNLNPLLTLKLPRIIYNKSFLLSLFKAFDMQIDIESHAHIISC